ncbi:hypothetical protein NGRA_2281 [Nosema granulosis]|uniref:Uncharacterized protein n=1 Tax=Nosema granulosis TaxID=83296 RepID=A0A9P6GZN7_9MICR|nr:hypothetical protein NGRA_2281 [Nosema granulosis]
MFTINGGKEKGAGRIFTQTTAVAEAEDETSRNENQVKGDTSLPTLSTSDALAALLESIETSEREWPQQALLSVMIRFGRMPRGVGAKLRMSSVLSSELTWAPLNSRKEHRRLSLVVVGDSALIENSCWKLPRGGRPSLPYSRRILSSNLRSKPMP